MVIYANHIFILCNFFSAVPLQQMGRMQSTTFFLLVYCPILQNYYQFNYLKIKVILIYPTEQYVHVTKIRGNYNEYICLKITICCNNKKCLPLSSFGMPAAIIPVRAKSKIQLNNHIHEDLGML